MTDTKYTRQTITAVQTWVPGKLFSVRVTRDPAFLFQAGQFARVGLPDSDDPQAEPSVWRAYSMVSAPEEPWLSSIPSWSPKASSARAWRACSPATPSMWKRSRSAS